MFSFFELFVQSVILFSFITSVIFSSLRLVILFSVPFVKYFTTTCVFCKYISCGLWFLTCLYYLVIIHPRLIPSININPPNNMAKTFSLKIHTLLFLRRFGFIFDRQRVLCIIVSHFRSCE